MINGWSLQGILHVRYLLNDGVFVSSVIFKLEGKNFDWHGFIKSQLNNCQSKNEELLSLVILEIWRTES